MLEPVSGKQLGLHARLILVDDDVSYVGSFNLDPRSLRLNTEMELVIEGQVLRRVSLAAPASGNIFSPERGSMCRG